MVILNKIYTRLGDDGTTALGSGERRKKYDLRIEAYGTVDETNATIGLARLHTRDLEPLDSMLQRIQNDLFDVGADLCTPDSGEELGYEPLRIVESQVARIEGDIDMLNSDLEPLRSFVLPGGSAAAAYLHLSRTVSRRAERAMVELTDSAVETINPVAIRYMNRLSDFFFVSARWANAQGNSVTIGDMLWVPGDNR